MLSTSTKSVFSRMHSWWEHAVLFEPKDWIQVEVTSACNAACVYCPRTIYRQTWQNRSISLDTFRRVLPVLDKAALVHLQGWGEPSLHPDFAEMVRMVGQAGCRVSTTTNGMLLNAERIRELITAGLDVLSFSLAGTTSRCNDPVRVGAPLDRVLEKIDLVRQIKAETNSITPALHIAYILLRSGLKDLEGLPELMVRHGVEQAVISLLDFEPDKALAKEVLAPKTAVARRKLEERFAALRTAASQTGVTIHTPRLSPKSADQPACSENVQQALFISADGQVSPCVFANIPVNEAGPVEYARKGRSTPYHRVTFGNVARELLPEIWRKESYRRFRANLAEGRPPEICMTCTKRER